MVSKEGGSVRPRENQGKGFEVAGRAGVGLVCILDSNSSSSTPERVIQILFLNKDFLNLIS